MSSETSRKALPRPAFHTHEREWKSLPGRADRHLEEAVGRRL
ncbi:hypothetical protein GMO_14650 [Gluconobacter morbifer G707]|uniref:Uncharacterized protein n=1 Tax=Gluconobacter morbifer G707 TaxID=1088869 RepID=G6XIZ9_9PROT|nr:hypothetical protein GMO_14650 [Gluconobacter morbifer G707]